LGPARGNAIGATAIQVFTKTPNQWREPVVRDADIAAFRSSFAASGIRAVVSHDSYLINLASPDEALRTKSMRAFTGELERCRTLGIPWAVSHPGNAERPATLDRTITRRNSSHHTTSYALIRLNKKTLRSTSPSLSISTYLVV